MFPNVLHYTLVSSFLWKVMLLCNNNEHPSARLPGDIMIGGIFPINKGVSNSSDQANGFLCTGFQPRSMIDALSMIFAIEAINNSTLLPGITLGYEIYDSCSDALKATNAILRMIPRAVDSMNSTDCNSTEIVPSIKAVVGEEYSEISIAISRFLSIHLIPQISPASSAAILSDKVRFPSFLRTVPNDKHQTEAMLKLIKTFRWNWIGLISSDDDYGRSALDFLHSMFIKEGICTAFTQILPSYLKHPDLPGALEATIRTLNKTSANVVVIISKGPIVLKLFKDLIRLNISKTWIASDAWSTSKEVSKIANIEKLGTVFGFNFKSNLVPGLADYLQNLYLPEDEAINEFIKQYKEARFGCTEDYKKYLECKKASSGSNSETNNCSNSDSVQFKSPLACRVENIYSANDDYLLNNTEWGKAYSTYLAITAVSQGLKKLLCKDGICDKNQTLSPRELLKELKNGNFSSNGDIFYFDSFGDVLIGYDVINWYYSSLETEFQIVGSYDIPEERIKLNESLLTWNTDSNQVPFSNCSQSCIPGYYKKHSSISCCYECIPCTENYYSSTSDSTECLKCPLVQWSNSGSFQCENRTIQCLNWSDPFAITLIIFAGSAFLFLIIIGAIFVKFSDKPPVKAAGGNYSYPMILSLLFSLVSICFFIGKPSDIICQIRQPLYGISFTLCVSCILIKSLRIILAFHFANRLETFAKITYKPVGIIIILTSIQIIICVLWMMLRRPFYSESYTTPQFIVLQCNEGSYVPFGMMLGYIGCLALICFVLAYRGRKLPEKYNEARSITFSMLIYMFVWILFIPVYMNTSGMYLSAVQVVAILSSVYGVMFCHLLPACYITLFKRKNCDRELYLRSVCAFYKAKQRVLSIYQNNADPQTSSFQNSQVQPKRFSTTMALKKRRKSF
uniref:G-protein coupled receptors family 3 profile domain-containing protein n=1 Tax=Leptobrachium leishanense TaxID=445787 RepID=A0A8C5QTG1_9ANUR